MDKLHWLYALTHELINATKMNPLEVSITRMSLDGTEDSRTVYAIMREANEAIEQLEKRQKH